MTCLIAPFAPRLQAVGPEASEPTVASDTPASPAASQVTVIVDVDEGQVPPVGIGPSPAVSVTVTGPDCVQVKFVDALVGAENVPLGADHAYVSAPGFGPVAVALSAIGEPT